MVIVNVSGLVPRGRFTAVTLVVVLEVVVPTFAHLVVPAVVVGSPVVAFLDIDGYLLRHVFGHESRLVRDRGRARMGVGLDLHRDVVSGGRGKGVVVAGASVFDDVRVGDKVILFFGLRVSLPFLLGPWHFGMLTWHSDVTRRKRARLASQEVPREHEEKKAMIREHRSHGKSSPSSSMQI